MSGCEKFKQLMIREKFKTEIGRQLFDELKAINNDISWMYDVMYDCRGDKNRKPLLDWLRQKPRTEDEVEEYLQMWE